MRNGQLVVPADTKNRATELCVSRKIVRILTEKRMKMK